jgi:hypothetical protein
MIQMRPRSVFQPGYAGGKMFVGVSDSLVVFLAIFVFVGVRIGIAAAPKLFDETFPLVIGFQFLKRFALFVSDDVSDVLVEPVLVGFLQLSWSFGKV